MFAAYEKLILEINKSSLKNELVAIFNPIKDRKQPYFNCQ